MDTEEKTSRFSSKLNNLKMILKEQLKLARQGNFSSVEALGERAAPIVEEISQSGDFEPAEFQGQREQIKKLYEELNLSLTIQKNHTAEELSRIRRGRKTIGAYRNNV